MKILGIDYGRVKIGLAIGDTATGLAEPWTTIRNFQFSSAGWRTNFQPIIKNQNIQKIVVGIPGGKIESEIRRFGQMLQKRTGIPVEFFDETLTSQDAQKKLIEIGKKRKTRQQMEDAFAAALMLELYLERRTDYV